MVLREKPVVEDFLLTEWHLCWGCICGDSVSTFPAHISVGISPLPQCVGLTQLVPKFLSEGIALCVAVHWCVCGRRNVQEPPVSPSWPQTQNKTLFFSLRKKKSLMVTWAKRLRPSRVTINYFGVNCLITLSTQTLRLISGRMWNPL